MLRLAAENDPLQVLSSTKFLVEEAKFVTINEDAIDMLLPQIQKRFAQGLDHITREKTLGSYEKDVQLNASSLSGLKEKNISNLDKLTAFADYKIPQMLRHFGVTSYADSLAQKVDSYILVQAESREELEIRASTIWASELLRQKMQSLTTAEIDKTLWLISQDQQGIKPYHRTYSEYY